MTSTPSGANARPTVGSCGPPGTVSACSVTSMTARSTVSAAGFATTTAASTGCRCAAGSAAATPTSASTTPSSGCVMARRSTWVAALDVWWPTWSSAECPRWGSTSRRPPSRWPAAAAPLPCAATCSNRCRAPAGGRPCCWPTATSASAVTRGAFCGGRANCCATAGAVVAEFDSADQRSPHGMGAARIVAHDRPVVPVGVGRRRLRVPAGRRRRPCGRRESTRSAAAWWPAWRRYEDHHVARHGRHRTRRPRAGCRGGGVFRHRADQSLHPAPAAMVLLADPAGLAIPRHAGPARHLRHRRNTADHRQAVVGVAKAVRASAHWWAGPADRTIVDPGAGRVDAVSAVDRPAEHRAVVRVQVLLHDEPLRDVLCRGRRGDRAHRREAAGHPSRIGGAGRR